MRKFSQVDYILKRGEEAWDDYMLSESSRLIRRFLREIYQKEAAANNRAPEETHRYGFALATTHAVGWGLSNDFGLPIPVVAIGTPSSDGGGRASLVVPLVKAKGEDPRALWCFSDPIELRSTEDNIIWTELENTFPERKAFAWATADEKSIEAWKKLCLETFSVRGIEPPNEYHESLKTISKHKLCLDTFSARGIKPPDEFHENAEQIKRARDREIRHKGYEGKKVPNSMMWPPDEALKLHGESLSNVTEKLSARVKELARKQQTN